MHSILASLYLRSYLKLSKGIFSSPSILEMPMTKLVCASNHDRNCMRNGILTEGPFMRSFSVKVVGIQNQDYLI